MEKIAIVDDEMHIRSLLEQTLEDLKQAKEKDIVLLHACCHNPSGADFSKEQWQEILKVVEAPLNT